jgi:PmbA protein
MMEALLEKARLASEQAEVYSLEQQSDQIHFENGRLKEIESKLQSGLCLRLIKDGCLGFTYTKNVLDRSELLAQALDSLKGKVEAPFDFPSTAPLPSPPVFDSTLPELSNASLVEEGQRICSLLQAGLSGEINVSLHRSVQNIRLLNSHGWDQSLTFSSYFCNVSLLFPGSQAGLDGHILEKGFRLFPENKLEGLRELFCQGSGEVRPEPGRMKVLFFPETLYALLWRFQAAANGKNIYEKTSPLLDKIGLPLFDAKLSLSDDPLRPDQPLARSFDDEGTACSSFELIRQGVLQNYYLDLYYAGKLKKAPTGHGYKSAMWGGETLALRPRPALEYLYLKPGDRSFREMVQSMDRGLLVAGVLGAHSGNILNGDFSFGLAPALYVEKGEIVGRVKDAMAAGNIYENLKEVVSLEDTAHPTYGGTFPALLLNEVNVTW